MHDPASFRLEGVSVRFGETPALEEVDLTIEAGEALALVGPSGSGKTTLLSCLHGGRRLAGGRVLANGSDFAELSPRALRAMRARIGWIPQGLGLVPNLRVAQNVLAGGLGRQSLRGSLRSMLLPSHAELARALELCASLGIGEKLFHRVDSLSGGQQQRTAVARALYQEPRALLADEPLAALDPTRARETLRLLVDLAREHSLTLILSLHDIRLAREAVPRLVGLRAGRVQFDRPALEVSDTEVEALYRLEGPGDVPEARSRR